MRIFEYTSSRLSSPLPCVTLDQVTTTLSPGDLTALAPADLDDRSRRAYGRLAHLLTTLPDPPADVFPRWGERRDALVCAARSGDGDAFDDALNQLYSHLAIRPEGYTPAERDRVDAAGGYWAHAGGVSAVLVARRWTTPDTVAIDLGAGTGLQGLLLQRLVPHRLTVQVEISRSLVAVGRALQRWLEVPGNRVAWALADVTDLRVRGVELVYLYRPVRPDHPSGGRFYARLAADLRTDPTVRTVVSVADALGPRLAPEFETVHADGQVTCLRRVTPLP
jgi:hypothetical protein